MATRTAPEKAGWRTYKIVVEEREPVIYVPEIRFEEQEAEPVILVNPVFEE